MRNVVLKVAQFPMLHNIDFHCNFFVLKILSNTTLIKYDATEGVLEKEISSVFVHFTFVIVDGFFIYTFFRRKQVIASWWGGLHILNFSQSVSPASESELQAWKTSRVRIRFCTERQIVLLQNTRFETLPMTKGGRGERAYERGCHEAWIENARNAETRKWRQEEVGMESPRDPRRNKKNVEICSWNDV